MPAKSSIFAKDSAMSAALERVRPMLIAIGGQRLWDDTKDHWRNKVARRVEMSARRVRAILSGTEKVSLTADEYLRIEERFRALDQRLSEDLGALSGLPPAGQVRAGGASDSGAGRQAPGDEKACLLTDRR